MYSQANVRVGKCAAAPYPSVAVRDRGHRKGVAGSGWVRGAGRGKTAHGWKGVRLGVRLKTEQKLARSPKITSAAKKSVIPSEEILQRIMGQTNKDCRFRIFILTNSPHQQPLLAGR